ncbi:MAG TPA: hypothetical protein VLY85_00770, partial [Thermoplasmata archaeon]|nr:hypothetical protein [Thermoplasmata archaeon]
EEATELFEILQGALARAVTATAPAPAPAAPPPPTPRAPSESRLPALADETLGLSLIAMGAGAGLLAAILKRGQEGPERKTP